MDERRITPEPDDLLITPYLDVSAITTKIIARPLRLSSKGLKSQGEIVAGERSSC